MQNLTLGKHITQLRLHCVFSSSQQYPFAATLKGRHLAVRRGVILKHSALAATQINYLLNKLILLLF